MTGLLHLQNLPEMNPLPVSGARNVLQRFLSMMSSGTRMSSSLQPFRRWKTTFLSPTLFTLFQGHNSSSGALANAPCDDLSNRLPAELQFDMLTCKLSAFRYSPWPSTVELRLFLL
ncbi:hypothetical protein Q3V30_21755 (plasmid) [Erwinia pyri]|uniref:Uncharacterized protein n=1 Tax=Erwinia pyri TaxID=3062598 RepID=A0AA50HPB1_9GAMM|nr:hypothetical protein [Erwinia sp. DE2]WLS81096.1 hypothetical protein Q3V30_21755 [Erwinia sp. DE2]